MRRKAFKRDPETRDFVVSGGKFVVVYDIDVVLQNCDHVMRQQLGELQYSQSTGIEYFDNVFTGTPNYQQFKYQAITQLEAVPGVVSVESFDYSVSGSVLSYTAVIKTEYGVGSISGNV